MATARLDWTASGALRPGSILVPMILVAGVPRVLTPAGVRPTTVAVSAGTVSSLFWPGTGSLTQTLPDGSTFGPVADLLDPTEVFSIYETASMLEAGADVENLVFSVLDTDGEGTALLSNREGRLSQLLAADLAPGATTATLESVVGMPASGLVAIGRETLSFSAVSGNDLTGLVRGLYGSKDRTHTAPDTHPPLVTVDGPRHWQSRLCSFWIASLSDDGTTVTDPTLLYLGTVSKGVQLRRELTRWSVSLEHVSKSLAVKFEPPAINLFGWSHYTYEGSDHPLRIFDNRTVNLSLGWDPADANDAGGFHPDAQSFIRAADAKVRAGTSNRVGVQLNAGGQITVTATGSNLIPTVTNVFAAFEPANQWVFHRTDSDNSPQAWTSSSLAPEACFTLDGWVKVPRSEDFGTIPTTLTWTGGSSGEAHLSLLCDSDGQQGVVSWIIERDATNQRVRLGNSGIPTWAHAGGRDVYPLLCTKRTPARLAVSARGDNVVDALLAAAQAIDAVTGTDLYAVCVDWDDLRRAFLSSPSGALPQSRVYRFGPGADTFLDVLRDELRLRGMVMAMVGGLITGVRLQNFSDAEDYVGDIEEGDNQADEGGNEMTPEVIDAGEPLATRMLFALPFGAGSVEIEDSTFTDEFGPGAKPVECKALLSVGSALPAIASSLSALYDVATQTLGALAEPNRIVRMPVGATHTGLQPGQRVRFTHARVPTWEGTRGYDKAVTQISDVRRELFGGKLSTTVGLRLQSGVWSGYAPEVLVAAGGLDPMSAVVTCDTTTPWGDTCFASKFTASNGASLDALDGFDVGDEVVISQLSSRTPIADEARTIVALDRVSGLITLDAPPGATMAGHAATRYGAIIRFAAYSSGTARQKARFAWIADQATQVLGGAASPKRWAA